MLVTGAEVAAPCADIWDGGRIAPATNGTNRLTLVVIIGITIWTHATLI
jgi:hypothetical protein